MKPGKRNISGLYKRGAVWYYRFTMDGVDHDKSTKCRNREDAHKVLDRVRSEIAMGNYGIEERKPAPTVAHFIDSSFLPFVETDHEITARTKTFYAFGAGMLKNSPLSSVPMDKITSKNTAQFVRTYQERDWKANSINMGVFTLRRIISLAFEWKDIQCRPKISALKTEIRDRVITVEEEQAYLEKADKILCAVAVTMIDCGLRPNEVLSLRWEDNFDWDRNQMKVLRGKSANAKRTLQISERMLEAFRQLSHGEESGWVFPGRKGTKGHLTLSRIQERHTEAMAAAEIKIPFVIYSMRHTCLTRMAEYTPLSTLQVIAGHSSITMTTRYVHPQQKSVEAAFAKRDERYKSRYTRKFKLVRKNQ